MLLMPEWVVSVTRAGYVNVLGPSSDGGATRPRLMDYCGHIRVVGDKVLADAPESTVWEVISFRRLDRSSGGSMSCYDKSDRSNFEAQYQRAILS